MRLEKRFFARGSDKILLQLNLELCEISGILSVVSYTRIFPDDAVTRSAAFSTKGPAECRNMI